MSDESSGVFGSHGARADGAGEAGGESGVGQPAGGLDPEKQSPRHPLGNRSPERAGTTRCMDQLVRPALAGRKATRKAHNIDDERERGGFTRSESREERTVVSRSGESAERVTESERDMERKGRERTGRAEAVKTTMHCMDKEGRSGSLSTNMHAGFLQTNATGGRERSDGRQTGLTSSRVGLTPTTSSRPALGSTSTSALQRPPIRSRTTPPPPPPQKSSQRTALSVEPCHCTPRTSSRESDPPWRPEVRLRSRAGQTPQSHARQTRLPSGGGPTPEEEVEEGEEEGGFVEEGEREEEGVEEEEAGGNVALEVISCTLTPAAQPSSSAGTADRRRSKREKNRVRSQRRRQRRREIWKQSRQQDNRQSSTSSSSSSSSEDEEEEEGSTRDREGYICAVCLDVYFSPYTCHPCSHVFCELCLRTLAKGSPANTPCPLCRTTITHVFFQKELNQTAKTLFPKEYLSRKQSFQKASCAKWPLPSTRKLFRIFGGFQRQSGFARRRFPHGGGYRVDDLDSDDEPRGWHLDMDMAVIYIYSVNWVIGFFIFFFLCYLFFPSF